MISLSVVTEMPSVFHSFVGLDGVDCRGLIVNDLKEKVYNVLMIQLILFGNNLTVQGGLLLL